MTTYTRQQLKHDKFVDATESSLSWVEANRNTVIGLAIAAVIVIAAIILGVTMYQHRSAQAQTAFGQALRTYSAPIRPAGVPADPTEETYGSDQERAKAAYNAFVAVAHQYGATPAGHNSLYYAGICAAGLGNTGTAEDLLKKAADSGSSDVRALAKIALAAVYHGANQDAEAIKLYQDVIAHPTSSVPANSARLQLAALYEQQKNLPEARKIWAQVKDSDKAANGQPGVAAEIATQKLNGQS